MEGVEPQKRHYQDELTIYQAVARHFEPTQTEGIVTVLIPHGEGRGAGANSPGASRSWRPCRPRPGLAVQIEVGSRRIVVGAKQDLRLDIARDHRRPRYLFEKGKVAYGAVDDRRRPRLPLRGAPAS